MTDRAPIEARKMTPKRRARLLEKHGHVCAYPECEVSTGLELDHFVALAIGGKDTDDNLRPLCPAHHKQKTALDAKLIAKCRRIIAREDGTRRERTAIPSRDFPKDLTRGFDGKVRQRDAR
jgi:5-methylcytosine-specific restriction endonuclease McrA